MANSDSKVAQARHPTDLHPDALTDDILNDILVDLGIQTFRQADAIKAKLKSHAMSFHIGRLRQNTHGSRQDDQARARRMVDHVEGLLAEFESLHPLVQLGFALRLADGDGDLSGWSRVEKDLHCVRDAARGIASAKFATKQPDEVLEWEVGCLMLFLETLTGKRAQVRRRNSATGEPPKLSTAEARTIAIVLRAAQPDLLDTTIVNTIVKIRKRHKGTSLNAFQNFVGAPVYAH